MSHRFRLITYLLLVCGLPNAARAHNGHVAVAEPVSGISIDGDLSDWPSKMKGKFIATTLYVYNGASVEDGFKGRYRAGFNRDENALYLAVEFEDDAIVLEGSGEEWNSRDACEVFLDLKHTAERTSPVQFVYRGRPYATFENQVNEELARAAKAARASDDNHLTYEWRIDLTELQGDKENITNGAVIGFDIAYLDRDPGGRFAFYSSSPGRHKHLSSLELGDLVIPPKNSKLAELSGRIRWDDQNIAPASQLRIQSRSNSASFFQLPLSAGGQFMVNLPVGEYELTAIGNSPGEVLSRPERLRIPKDTVLDASLTFEVAVNEQPEDATPDLSDSIVYYDLAHGQQLQSQLRQLGNRLGFSLRSSDEPISNGSLGNANLLYIRAPKSEFSAAEKDAVIQFVRNGGSLFVVMDQQKRTSLERTQVNDLVETFGLKFTDDTEYIHNCGAISRAGVIHRQDLEIPFSGGRAVEGGTPFGFQLDRDGNPSHPFASFVKTPQGGKIVLLGEGMASLFLGSKDGRRLSGDSANYGNTNYWGKDSVQFNVDLFRWLLSDSDA